METLRRAASFFFGHYQQPEKFYHGFVLGLMAEQVENYVIKSNQESGFGRYDIMMLQKRSTSGNHYGFAFDGKNVLIGSDGENIQY